MIDYALILSDSTKEEANEIVSAAAFLIEILEELEETLETSRNAGRKSL